MSASETYYVSTSSPCLLRLYGELSLSALRSWEGCFDGCGLMRRAGEQRRNSMYGFKISFVVGIVPDKHVHKYAYVERSVLRIHVHPQSPGWLAGVFRETQPAPPPRPPPISEKLGGRGKERKGLHQILNFGSHFFYCIFFAGSWEVASANHIKSKITKTMSPLGETKHKTESLQTIFRGLPFIFHSPYRRIISSATTNFSSKR